jgi:putative SOS response-associated peptidase YedK
MTATIPKDRLGRLLDADDSDAPDLPPSWNVAPTQPAYAVASSLSGVRRLRVLHWGLVPNWSQGPAIGAKLINARAETVSGKPAFRSLVERHRALVPVSGFYEWRRPGVNGDGSKQPFYFRRPDGGPLVFAGLWDLWKDAESRPLRSFTIITTAANQTMAPVHHRMPAVLLPPDWDEWLHPGPLRKGRLADLLVPAPEDALEAYPVGSGVNKSANDGPELIEPAVVPQQGTLTALWDSALGAG